MTFRMGFFHLSVVLLLFLVHPDQGTSRSYRPVYSSKRSSGSYFITASDYIQRGMTYNVSVDILNTTDPVQVLAEIQRDWYNGSKTHSSQVAIQENTFNKGFTGTLSLDIPKSLDAGSYYLRVRGKGGLNFERRRSVSLRRKAVSIMIQTDKAMYKPGQTVRFRAFGIYPNSQVYEGKFRATITDPNRNILKRFTDLQEPLGVIEESFQLADKPPMGSWSIHVETTDQVQTNTKNFEVSEYRLPRFEVKVDLPSFALTSDTLLSGTVKATYTFGKKVKGMVELRVYVNSGKDVCGRPPKYTELAFPIDGEAKFDVPIGHIKRLQNYLERQSVIVDAYVKEELTGVKLMGSSSVKYHKYPYKVDILSSSPKTFSPQLPYTFFVKVSQQDDLPVPDVTSPVSVYTCVHYQIVQEDQSEYGCSSFNGQYGLPGQNYTVPKSGLIPVDVRIPENTTSIDIKVRYRGVTDRLSVQQKRSASNNYIQLKLVSKELKACQRADFTVEYTDKNVSSITYVVQSRGTVETIGQVAVGTQNPAAFSVEVSSSMAPVAHIVAYYTRPDTGEIIADGLAFSVTCAFANKVSIAFSPNESKPQETVDVVLTADPGSSVNLLAVDQSVLLLKSGNDITTDTVLKELKSYGTGNVAGDLSDEVLAISSSSTNPNGVFSDAGLFTLTDAVYNNYNDYDYDIQGMAPRPLGGQNAFPSFSTSQRFGRGSGGQRQRKRAESGFSSGSRAQVKEVENVRKEFPETWLWLNKTTGPDGRAIISTKVPDTITSWVASAFAVNSVTGLGVAPTQAKLRVFRSFFVSLSMPYSVLRGEQVVIQASVFNYLPEDLNVIVSLPKSQSYINVNIDDSTGKTSRESKDQFMYIRAKSNEPQTVYFPIIPSALGSIDIEVSARSTASADAVRRQIFVKPEGIPKEYSVPVLIDLTNGGPNFNKQVPLPLPPEAVSGSDRARFTVTGDLIGSSLDNLEKLLDLPTGCGEQNMMKFAPDVYIADYLNTTHQMTPALESRIIHFLELGYQNQLGYQRRDGSFSAFGNRDEAGSMWLTAFVTRVFHQARPYILVGNNTLTRAVSWMINRQNKDGSFNEPGLVLDRQMQRSRATLTAMVMLALLENKDLAGYGIDKNSCGNATEKATKYLENVAPSVTDTFELAVISYALAVAGSNMAQQTFNRLDADAKVHGSLKYWTDQNATTTPTTYYTRWSPPHVAARPIDIQTTAYALLASSALGDLQGGLPITSWLTSQRNPFGGFSSTQDTMVALQALTDYASRSRASGLNLQVDISEATFNHQLTVTDNNALVLQIRQFPMVPPGVVVTANGMGVAYGNIDVFYHVEAEIGKPSFDVSTVLLDDTINNFRLMICTKWLKEGSSGMAVMEISIPSGFSPDLSTLDKVAGIKRAEMRGSNVVIYFDQIGTTSTCFDFRNSRTGMVFDHQKSYITIHDYYQPSNQASAFYETRSLREATICDVCEKCCHPWYVTI